MIHARQAAALAIAALVLAGCSVLGEKTVPREELEDRVRQLMEEQAGQPVESVTCDGDLAGELDAETRCTIVATDGSTIGLTVTATDVDGNDVRYEITVDGEATAPPTAEATAESTATPTER